MKTSIARIIASLAVLVSCGSGVGQIVFTGTNGPGLGKHIVLLAGDEEYRSEEAFPMLARLLAMRHGFKCTVVLPINPTDGTIDPNVQTNLPGIEALDTADVCVLGLRFRELPDAQMKHFVDYYQRGKPFVALRTSTHAFHYTRNPTNPYARFDWRNKEWPGGFGQQVLGETWVNHHGAHGKESTKGIVNRTPPPVLDEKAPKSPPALRAPHRALALMTALAMDAETPIWGPTDVYGVVHLPKDAQVLVWGQVLSGMSPTNPPVTGAKNDPMMPVAWVRDLETESGAKQKIFTTTMGAAVDLESEGLRRLIVNACFWAADVTIPVKANVDYVGEYRPTMFGFDKFKRGVKPADVLGTRSER